MNCFSIKNIPCEDRPRERLAKLGAESLATAELIAVILGKGTKSTPILQLAHELLSHFGDLPAIHDATINELCQIKGIGPAKAIQLKASLALGLRAAKHTQNPRTKIEHPFQAYELLREELQNEKREIFKVILQDTKGYLISHEIISIGTLSQTLVHPREVFYPAIRHKAATIILAHNHPSGDPTPSAQDFDLTNKLIVAAQCVQIPIVDHIIIGKDQYISLRQNGFRF